MTTATTPIAVGVLLMVAGLVAASCGDAAEPAYAPPPTSAPTASVTTTPVAPPSTVADTSGTTRIDRTNPGHADLVAAAGVAIHEWTSAVAAGETQRAWDLMAESSRRAVGSYAFFGELATELAEGWGAWSRVDDLTVAIESDAAGRTMARLHAVVTREGMTETADAVMFLAVDGRSVTVSPFEEFGNVAVGLAQESAVPPLPAGSGSGRRIVYANAVQRVWVVEADGTILDSYLVSGRRGVPAPGDYEVYSMSEMASAGHDGITMRFMVRFARSPTSGIAIGFHSIPNRADGTPLQTEEQLGEYHSAGCVRQSLGHAAALYAWADVGTKVVVLP